MISLLSNESTPKNAFNILSHYLKVVKNIELEPQIEKEKYQEAVYASAPKVELIFLDRHMVRLSSSELEQQLPALIKIVISYPKSKNEEQEQTPQSYEFFTKPILFPDNHRSLQHYSEAIDDQPAWLTAAIANTSHFSNAFIFVKNDYKMIKLKIADILYLEAKGNYVCIYTTKSKVLTQQTMKKLEMLLQPYQFVRVHKSYIVAFQHIDAIDKTSVIINDVTVPLSDSYKQSFQSFVENHSKLY